MSECLCIGCYLCYQEGNYCPKCAAREKRKLSEDVEIIQAGVDIDETEIARLQEKVRSNRSDINWMKERIAKL
jgi:hypothetical protein